MKKLLAAAAVAAASFLPVGLPAAEAAPVHPAPGSTLACTTSFHLLNTSYGPHSSDSQYIDGSGTCVDQATLDQFPFRFRNPDAYTVQSFGCPAPYIPLFFDIGAGHYGPNAWLPTSLLLNLGQPSLSVLQLGPLAAGVPMPQLMTGELAATGSAAGGRAGGGITFIGTESCGGAAPGNFRSEYRGQLVMTVTVEEPSAVG